MMVDRQHLPTENSGECSACFEAWPCDVAKAWEAAHDEFCPRGKYCSTHLRSGDRYRYQEDVTETAKDRVRERVVALVAELADTLSDPTQAWDVAVADFDAALVNLLLEAKPT